MPSHKQEGSYLRSNRLSRSLKEGQREKRVRGRMSAESRGRDCCPLVEASNALTSTCCRDAGPGEREHFFGKRGQSNAMFRDGAVIAWRGRIRLAVNNVFQSGQ